MNYNHYGGSGGGGASDIKLNCSDYSTVIVVAGGGGGCKSACTFNSTNNGGYPGSQFVHAILHICQLNKVVKLMEEFIEPANMEAHSPALLDKAETHIPNTGEEVVVDTTVAGEGMIPLARVVRAIAMWMELVVIRLTPSLQLWQMD